LLCSERGKYGPEDCEEKIKYSFHTLVLYVVQM
jgi:hypothetical protein